MNLPRRSMAKAGTALAVSALFATACSGDAPSAGLPALKLDAARTTVSGLSSGAYMATQVHLAYSDRIAGAALFAGGPYGCAQGSLEIALGSCLAPEAGMLPDVAALADTVRARAAGGRIAALDGLAGDAVLVMHGALDTTVGMAVSNAAAELYRELGGARVELDDGRAIAHTFPTMDKGGACDRSESPYIGQCGFDGAAALFAALYGPPPAAVGAADGELRRFDQDAYRADGKDAMLAEQGFVYVPKACAAGETCGLHIAFHGCQQNADAIGEAFVRDAGYNRWADAYGVVVLYPQTRASFAPLNPKACWDWWGYGGVDYDTRDGVQLRWLAKAAAALGAPLE
ncbi:MAG TPA: PHB depolymerase family esterase [Dokdonella sp.]|uniref:extracellular catalytic domain type 2 short-chain-length polyhydroxyalkanoate depolymerase n=1 Tax=Dokdonella sp. TaxID=2291710 RepID=UPI0025B96C34|nr:PHB depolymerase family esterase [Dokdonella sp.]HNR91682.1 PHB depolymerase family esterase [Dokdonella sp.]